MVDQRTIHLIPAFRIPVCTITLTALIILEADVVRSAGGKIAAGPAGSIP